MKTLRKLTTMLRLGLKGVWKHKSMGFASVISIVATLLVLGIVLIATVTANSLSRDVRKKVDEVEIFLSMKISDADRQALEERIKNDPAVDRYVYRSSEDALNLMKKSWGKDAYILEGLEKEGPILEPSFLVRLKNIESADEFAESMRSERGVRDVTYYQDLVRQISRITRAIRLGGAVMVGILVLVSLFIILNTVKLTVISRSREISVMKYVGATNHMIRGPFVIEGVIFGFIGSVAAFALVYFSYAALYYRYAPRVYELISAYLIRPERLAGDMLLIFLSIGVGIGMAGSLLTVGRTVRVR